MRWSIQTVAHRFRSCSLSLSAGKVSNGLIAHQVNPLPDCSKMWIAGDVVPSIHATGSYSVRRDNLDIQLKAIDIERAKILQHMLDTPAAPLSEESRAVIQHEVFKIITGEQCLSMLPAIADKYYSATEIGEMFGVSSKKIGKVAKANGLKSEEGEPAQFGQWRLTKSPLSDHQCSVFVYNSSALEWFKAHSDLLK